MTIHKKITATQLYMTFILSIGISDHVLLIPVLLNEGVRDAWVGVLLSILPTALWVFLLYLISRKLGTQPLHVWLKQRYGRALSLLVVAVVITLCLALSMISIKDMVTWTKTAYLQRTPAAVIVVTFLILCFWAAKAGLRAIAITSGILLPIVAVLGFFVMAANIHFKDYSLLFPLFTHGYEPALKSALKTCGGQAEMLLILFLQHHASTPIRFTSLLLLAVILTVLTLGPLAGAIAIFGPFEAANLRYPAFEQWRMVILGKYISHLDFFSIYQWMSGIFVRISLMLFLILDVLGAKSDRTQVFLLTGICALYAAFSLYPLDDVTFLQQLATWFYPAVSGCSFSVAVLLLVLVVLLGKRKEKAGST